MEKSKIIEEVNKIKNVVNQMEDVTHLSSFFYYNKPNFNPVLKSQIKVFRGIIYDCSILLRCICACIKDNTDCGYDYEFGFEEAAGYLEAGCVLTRKAWKDKILVVKIFPNNVDEELYSNITIIPKQLIYAMRRQTDLFEQRSMCAEYYVSDKENIQRWKPCRQDLFAHDWRIVE